jgi:hypothetical protein
LSWLYKGLKISCFYIAILVASCILISITSAQTGIDDNGFALLIDVSEYKDAKISPLLPKYGDVDKIKKSLVSIGGFPDSQVYVVSGQNATREGITEALTAIVESAKSKPNTRFLLYFRGRSLKVQGINYYLPYDARIGATSTYIEDNEFERWLGQASFKKSFIQVEIGMDNQDSKGLSSLLANILSDEQTDSDGDRNITLAEVETKVRGDYPIRISGNRSNVIIRLPSVLVVNTQPPGASVILDGVEKGKSPKITNLTLGNHQLLVKKELYRIPEEKTINVTVDRGQFISVPVYQLIPIKVYGVVKFPDNKPASNIEVRVADTAYRQKMASNGSFSFSDWQAYGIESGKTYSLIAQSPDGMYTGRTSFTFSGTEDISLNISLKKENWIEAINRLLRNNEISAVGDILNSMIQSYEQGESSLLIEETSTKMPKPIIRLLLKNVEDKLLLKPDNMRLQFLAAKLAEFNGDNDSAKQHWLTVKANAPKDSNEYKQAIARLKVLNPDHKPLIFVIAIIVVIVGGFIAFYLTRKKKHIAEYQEIPNPYLAGKPISDRNMFFGREDVFNFIKDILNRSNKEKYSIVLCGGRRTGKTSIMYQIVNGRLGDDFVPVFIDMQEMAGVDLRGFFSKIAQKIIEVVKVNMPPEDLKNLDDLYQALDDKTVSAYQNFSQLVTDVISKISGKYLILLVDEYELIETKVAAGDLTDDIFTHLRGMMQNMNNLIFIFAGSRNFEGINRRKEWPLMLNLTKKKEVSFLNKEDAIALITKPVQEYVKYDKKAIDRLLRLTSGQPFFTQDICFHIIEKLNDKKQNKVTIEDVNISCQYLVDNAPYHFGYIWSELKEPIKKIVVALLAEVLVNEDIYASIDDVVSRLSKYELKFNRTDIGRTLGQLEEDDLIERKENSELYRFRMGLTRIWIQTEHSTWGVLREVQDHK